MRIVSLLPSTTEILFALGAGDDVVGVTFECDTPAEARTRRIVSSTTLAEGLSPREIDDAVSAAVARGEDLYRLDAGALADLDADLVVTQDLCAVCAVDVSVVDDALAHLGCSAEVLTVDPHTLDEVFGSIVSLGRATGREHAAHGMVASLEERREVVRAHVADRERPRVMVLEWVDPPYFPGHWIPEDGACCRGRAGARCGGGAVRANDLGCRARIRPGRRGLRPLWLRPGGGAGPGRRAAGVRRAAGWRAGARRRRECRVGQARAAGSSTASRSWPTCCIPWRADHWTTRLLRMICPERPRVPVRVATVDGMTLGPRR